MRSWLLILMERCGGLVVGVDGLLRDVVLGELGGGFCEDASEELSHTHFSTVRLGVGGREHEVYFTPTIFILFCTNLYI